MIGLLASAQEMTSSHSSESRQKFYTPQSYRKILCVFPEYSRSLGTLHHAYPLMWNVRAFMPPQGLLIAAAYLPQAWDVRFVDENVRSVTRSDYQSTHAPPNGLSHFFWRFLLISFVTKP